MAGVCITSLTMPQMRCFAPSMSPPIEPVVSRTKTISKVLSAFFPLARGPCGVGPALVLSSAEAAPTPTAKVSKAVESLNRLRFIFVSLFHEMSVRGLNGGRERLLRKKNRVAGAGLTP